MSADSSLIVPISNGPAQQTRVAQDFGKMPLYFVENQGQVNEQVAYYIQGSDKTIYFTPDGVTFALTAPLTPAVSLQEKSLDSQRLPADKQEMQEVQHWAVKLDFVGANPNVWPVGQEKTDAVVSYFKGPQDQWHAGLPTYSRIVYHDLWSGIDLVYYGTVNQLRYEFIVQPGADPNQIHLTYRGATNVSLTPDGQLRVITPIGGFNDDAPVAYQDIDEQRIPVSVSYSLHDSAEQSSANRSSTAGHQQSYAFAIGRYDPTRPLILDPAVIVYCGYIGGDGIDEGWDIAVDNAGNAYVTGYAISTEASFPVTVGPDLTFNGGGDAFVVKVSATGAGLIYAGYIGGNNDDHGVGVTVDSGGNAYVTGYTYSTETSFPVIVGPDLTFNGGGDAFVVKVNAVAPA